MKTRFTKCLLLASVLAVAILPRPVHAQAPPDQKIQIPPLEVRVYQLQHISAEDARERVDEIFRRSSFGKSITLSAHERTNALICRAPVPYLEDIAALIQKIDVPEAVGRDGVVTTMYQVKHRDLEEIVEVLVESLDHPGMAILSDASTGMLILRAPAAVQERATLLLQKLDVPAAEQRSAESAAPPRTIMVYFILAQFGASGACELPPVLNDVATALAGHSVGGCKPFGHVMARGDSFQAEGLIRSGHSEAGPTHLRVHGNVLASDSQTAEVMIEAQLVVPVPRGRDGEGHVVYHREDFSLGTTAPVPLGDYVVLGAIPMTIEDSDTVIMVLRVN